MHLSRLIAPLLLTAQLASSASLPLRITSFNIRYAATSLETNELPWWTLLCPIWASLCRLPHSTKHLAQIAANATTLYGTPTIFGLQEVLNNQLTDILSGLGSEWSHIGVGRDDGATSGEYSPIIYKPAVFSVVYSETKWLSTTPDVVSYGWGAGSRRIVTLAVFQHVATGKRFIHANTHLDNVSSQARSEGIKVVVARVQAAQAVYGVLPVVITGDFNSVPGGDAYTTLVGLGYAEDIWNIAPHAGTNQLTYTGFTPNGISRIDFIFLGPLSSGLYEGRKIEFLGNVDEGVYISDHRSVVGDITFL
ncbi:endonuclease/Exonuclease/phosphatase [Bisporella sp. PMI_857]|nr:endonuclease/Exonuclease/phosphatase [Bisporella sp. PMI_857]